MKWCVVTSSSGVYHHMCLNSSPNRWYKKQEPYEVTEPFECEKSGERFLAGEIVLQVRDAS